MAHYLIVTDQPRNIPVQENYLVISSSAFLRKDFEIDTKSAPRKKLKIINLCSSFDYLSKGYYVSLLAEARGMACLPHISNIVSVNWKRNYEFALPQINALVKKHYIEPPNEPLARTFTTYFGRHGYGNLEPVTRGIFDLFRFPVLSFELKYTEGRGWHVTKIEAGSIYGLCELRQKNFQEALENFTGSTWRMPAVNKKTERYWIAILHDPEEALPPSCKSALKRFIKVGKQLGIWVELITRQDFPSLLEYDALFIRETTAINNHTYRFAAKAEQEDIPCIDDTHSIIRCCNKVYLHELLKQHQVPVPETILIDRKTRLTDLLQKITYPVVLKVPDGAFSKGMHKAETQQEFIAGANVLLKKSELIVCQSFVYSEFDWRIGVLGGKPIFAVQYFMAAGHWQIVNHDAKQKSQKLGDHRSVCLDQVPPEVLSVALQAASLIGSGLYGVDLKQTKNGEVVVMEVNDNPNIDHGVEDTIEGDRLYKTILEHLVQMIEA